MTPDHAAVVEHRSVLDCAPLAPRERFDAWRDAVNHSFVPLTADHPGHRDRDGFMGALVSQPLGRTSVSTVSGSPVHVSRSSREIAQSDPGHIKLGLQLNGYSVIAQDGRDAALAPGDFALYDTTRPYTLDFDGTYRMFVVMFPVEALRVDRRTLSELTALRFSGRQGIGAIASSFLAAISRQLDDGALGGALPLADAVLDMLSATIAERTETMGALDEDTHRRMLRARVEAYIRMHLSDPDLTVAGIADTHHVSVRYLQKLFEERHETVSGWIRSCRLEESRRDLTSPFASGTAIAAVGARWGFADAGAFARAFRKQYGTTPSEYRASAHGID